MKANTPQLAIPDLKKSVEYKISTLYLIGLSIIVGIMSALAAMGLNLLINFIFNLSFNGIIVFSLNETSHMSPSIWGMGVILVPVIGSLIVTWLTSTFAPEAKGHGVPEVLYAIHYKDGIIRPIVAIVKAFASAICIGTGGSVGHEGPIIQIGAALGAVTGQIIKMSIQQRTILIAAGAGAGLAAIFNAPLAGIAFAIELILVSIHALSIGVVSVAVIAATIVIYVISGNETLFIYEAINPARTVTQLTPILLLSLLFGLLLGFVSARFIYATCWFENIFEKFFKNYYLRHCVGMLGVGIIFYAFMYCYGQYYVAGVGYATVQDLISNLITNPWLLILLFFGKLFAMSLTLGSGGSGGVFSPALYLGAVIGALYGLVASYLFPSLFINPAIFVLTGMAGMVGATTGAFITAIILLFEITKDYNNIFPTILTVSIAYIVRVYFSPQSIYTIKIFRQGFTVPLGLKDRFNKHH